MVTLEELYKRDQESKKVKFNKFNKTSDEDIEEQKRAKRDGWKPFEITGISPPEFSIPVRKSNNFESSKRDMLSRVLTFIEYAQRKRIKGGCTAMPIPVTSRQNLMIWGYPKAVSRAIAFMLEIGLISVYDGTYRFGVPYEGGNYGKIYAYYYESEEKVIQYCRENNISKFQVANVEDVDSEDKKRKISSVNSKKSFEITDVKFDRGANLEKPEGVSSTDFELFLTYCLYLNYPEFRFHQSKIDEINEKYYKDYPEFKLRFKPHFTWKNNKVTKIGIRMANEFCNKEKEERKELLKKYGFNLEKDVKSSVPRLTLSINKGEWVDESIDIYELINKEFEPGVEFNQERREAIKHYLLSVYFEDSSDKMLGKNATYKLDKTGLVKSEVDELMGRLRSAAVKVVGGKFYGSEIFYIESCVYLMTVYDLLASGHMVWLVYDCFYASGIEDEETFEEMIKNSCRLNFGYFMEKSKFNKDRVEENNGAGINNLLVKDVVDKYKVN